MSNQKNMPFQNRPFFSTPFSFFPLDWRVKTLSSIFVLIKSRSWFIFSIISRNVEGSFVCPHVPAHKAKQLILSVEGFHLVATLLQSNFSASGELINCYEILVYSLLFLSIEYMIHLSMVCFNHKISITIFYKESVTPFYL